MKKTIAWIGGSVAVLIVVFAALAIIWQIFFDNSASTVAISAATKESVQANRQQEQYNIAQPPPQFDWSLERFLTNETLRIRNERVRTYTVWRSYTGKIVGHCPSLGYSLPWSTTIVSRTKPYESIYDPVSELSRVTASTTIEQLQPNGVYVGDNASSSATWVFCIKNNRLEPNYVETFVETYPYRNVKIADDGMTVVKIGEAETTIPLSKIKDFGIDIGGLDDAPAAVAETNSSG